MHIRCCQDTAIISYHKVHNTAVNVNYNLNSKSCIEKLAQHYDNEHIQNYKKLQFLMLTSRILKRHKRLRTYIYIYIYIFLYIYSTLHVL